MSSLQRIRLVFLALSLVILTALAILIGKAFESAENESSVAHQVVAERIFDEMERELTNFLRHEESRPFEHYRASFVPETSPPGSQEITELSPIAGVPKEDFVLGYFQIYPDGSFGSPHRAIHGPESAEAVDWVDELEEVVRLVWRLEEDERQDPRQQAGSTVEVAKKSTEKKQLGFNYFDSLNRATQSRGRRASKLEQTQANNVFNEQLEAAEEVIRSEADLDDAASREQGSVSPGRQVSELKQQVTPGFYDVRVEPMVGRLASPGLLVLYRTVTVKAEAFRQGLLISETDLIDWLARRVVTDRQLASRAVVQADVAGGEVATPTENRTYRRRFAEPFGSVYALLNLEELPRLTGAEFLTVIALLLVVTATLGLFGLYRMVAVVVEFAERRHNFVSAVTHELKTPLTAIRMYGEMLRDGVIPDESKRQQYYETITSETERLTRLLQNVLELSQLEKDTRSMSLTVGDVGPVLAEVSALLEPHARKQGFALRVEVEAEEELPQVRYDRDALVQVLFNLVDNALKYARKAEDKEIVLRVRAKEGGVAISVVDHGPGVAREHLGKIFEPFYRGESELTRTAKGTGIGLALVRGLVERMGGRVVGKNARSGGFEVVVSLSAF